MDCGTCGLDNRPYVVVCAKCGEELQDAAKADAKRREWDALPAGARAELERNYDEAERALVRHGSRKRRSLLVNAVVGALLFPVISNLVFPSSLKWMLVFLASDALSGAVALYALVRVGGGLPRGLLYVICAYCASTGIRTLQGETEMGQSVVWVYGFIVAAALGLYFGWKTDEERAEQSIA